MLSIWSWDLLNDRSTLYLPTLTPFSTSPIYIGKYINKPYVLHGMSRFSPTYCFLHVCMYTVDGVPQRPSGWYTAKSMGTRRVLVKPQKHRQRRPCAATMGFTQAPSKHQALHPILFPAQSTGPSIRAPSDWPIPPPPVRQGLRVDLVWHGTVHSKGLAVAITVHSVPTPGQWGSWLKRLFMVQFYTFY